MRAIVQRVSRAKVTVEGEITGQIGLGLLVLLGVGREDSESDVKYLAEKIAGLRVFEDDAGKMNRSVAEVGGSAWLVGDRVEDRGAAAGPRRPLSLRFLCHLPASR